MRVNLVKIGNSQGIRIPKPLLEQCAFGSVAELEVRDGKIVIAPVKAARSQWDAMFQAAGAMKDEELALAGAGANEFDREEWEW
jgi:antitoxin MazE